jgi:hypothetical protein
MNTKSSGSVQRRPTSWLRSMCQRTVGPPRSRTARSTTRRVAQAVPRQPAASPRLSANGSIRCSTASDGRLRTSTSAEEPS